ncbi:hypothetical protein TNCV_503251 [Trichonephila clavipes]|nr:hypothetical protein TNCV_503251 [Trichonephila clavipes]
MKGYFRTTMIHLMTNCLSECATEFDEIVDSSEPMNSDSNTEIDNETPIKSATFPNVFIVSKLGKQDVNDAVFLSISFYFLAVEWKVCNF